MRGTKRDIARDCGELGFAQLMIAAQQDQQRLTVGHQHQALHLRAFRQSGEGTHFRNGLAPRRVKFLGLQVAFRIGREWCAGMRGGLFEIGRVAALPAHYDEVLACLRFHHEFVRLTPAHGARVSLQTAPLKDAAIGVVVFPISRVQAGRVHVERVGILHNELAHAQEPRFRPLLIAKLGLNLIPDLRQLLVAAQFAARGGGDHFFVGHAQTQVALKAVLQPEHVVTHDVPAARFLP